MLLRIEISEDIEVPEGSVSVLGRGVARNGLVRSGGIRLPSGEVIKPWITYELLTDASGREVCRDLSHEELEARGMEVLLDYDLTVQARED